MKKVTILLAGMVLAAMPHVYGVGYTETGTAYDSHDLAGSPAAPNPEVAFSSANALQSLTSIAGTLSLNAGLSETDFYKIYISNPANFSASTLSLAGGRNGFDTQLFLFNVNGTGIAANDDYNSNGSSSPDSLLPAGNALYAGLNPGFYLLAITGGGKYPQDAAGTIIFPNQGEGNDPTRVYGPKTGEGASPIRSYNGSSDQGGTYSIALTGVSYSVPEPSALWLAIGSLGLLIWIGKLRRGAGSAA